MKSTNHVEFHELLSHAASMGYSWNDACDFMSCVRPEYEIRSFDFHDGEFWIDETIYDDEDPEYNAFSEAQDDAEYEDDHIYKARAIKEKLPDGKVIRYCSTRYATKEAVIVMVSFFEKHQVSEITVTP